jgi:hypothetical protein
MRAVISCGIVGLGKMRKRSMSIEFDLDENNEQIEESMQHLPF